LNDVKNDWVDVIGVGTEILGSGDGAMSESPNALLLLLPSQDGDGDARGGAPTMGTRLGGESRRDLWLRVREEREWRLELVEVELESQAVANCGCDCICV